MRALRLFWLIIVTTGCTVASGANAEHRCGNWQVRKLNETPAWYSSAFSKPWYTAGVRITDSVMRLDYPLKDGSRVVQYWRDPHPSEGDSVSLYIAPGSLYLCGADTVLLDSNLYGHSILSFGNDSTEFVMGRLHTIDDQEHSSDIILFDLKSRQQTVLHAWVDDCGPALAPKWPFVAYSDKGDLYVFDKTTMVAELVFQRGGSYATEDCEGHSIGGIRWLPNGDKSLVFKYYDDATTDNYVLYETYWSPWSESVDSTDD